ncbi:hypothetical protein GCM10009430_23320 [Aquimarina litoralis]|uniref:Endonuclease G n=1 Tax=Aquimarina litoralis TaxID=584605 RepID=A0ABP3U431_9FLAO
MKLLKPNPSLWILSFAFFFTSCNIDDDNYNAEIQNVSNTIIGEFKAGTFLYDNEGPHDYSFHLKTQEGFIETYESGSKSSYAGASVSLSSGDWYLNDALLGGLSNDRKYQSKSVRIRNTGYAIMSFNMDNGVETIRIRHAKYGNDGNSTWRLIASYDNGVSWYYVGSTITTNSTTLNTVSFDVNETSSVRYGIQKLSGGSNRINIDNVEIITDTNSGSSPGIDSNITFGNPSDAGTSSTNYYLSKPDFSLSYNNNTGTANWVSWHLSSAWTGDTPRCNCFKRDNDLPSSFFRATSSDYTNSGFDRGHLCPSADRNGTEDSNENTYYMSNIAPQAPDNNRKSWANFESYLRSLTLDGNEVHIIAGVAGSGGIGGNGFATTIDGGNITVPDSFWKVALILPNGTNDINRVTTSTRVIAINIPNDQGITSDWTQFRTSVDAIESLTGYDLFENITNSIESVIESVVDNGPSS